MKVFTSLEQLPRIENLVLTIGTFDGVHLGHSHIIKRIVDKAKSINGKSGVMTFHPHPRMVLQPEYSGLHLLSTIAERASLMANLGLDYLFVIPFSAEFSNMSAEDYVKDVLVASFQPKHIVIGYDHQFGKNRQGSFHTLKALENTYNFEVEQVEKQVVDDLTLSSTLIRDALEQGNIQLANTSLGYDYGLSGYVVHGEKRGRKIGYPTANITADDDMKLIPADGVYGVLVKLQGKVYRGMLNIGSRPTFAGNEKTIEVHIIDFDNDIYGQHIEVVFQFFVRKELKFKSIDQLTAQLNKDKELRFL